MRKIEEVISDLERDPSQGIRFDNWRLRLLRIQAGNYRTVLREVMYSCNANVDEMECIAIVCEAIGRNYAANGNRVSDDFQ